MTNEEYRKQQDAKYGNNANIKHIDLGVRKEPGSRKKYKTTIESTGEEWVYTGEQAQGVTRSFEKRG